MTVISTICSSILICIETLSGYSGILSSAKEQADTSYINTTNLNLLTNARRNPDIVIPVARGILRQSSDIGYLQGVADASLILGSAWLAKYYNISDSALYYNMQAYDIYKELDNPLGKARACYNLAYVCSIGGDPTEAERYGSLSLNFFEEAGEERGMVNAYNVLSYIAQHSKDFKKALAFIQQAIDIARSTNDTLPLADVTNSLGNIYKDMALFSQATDAYFEALRLWEARGDSSGISIAYGSIGLVYFFQKDWQKALEYCFKKVPVVSARNDLWELSKTYNTIAEIYNAKASHDSALIYFRKGLQLNQQMNYPAMIAGSYNFIASTFLMLSLPDSAEFYINKTMAIASQIDDTDLVNYYITLGNVLKTRGKSSEALKNLLKAYSIGREKKFPMAIHDASILLSEIYSSLGSNDLAYKYLKEYYQLKDSISNADYLRQVTRMELQYDFDKKQKAAEFERIEERILHENQVRQQRTAITGLIILAFLVAIISFLLLRHISLRSRLTQIDLEQRLLRAQMNPHFIFNSMCAIQDLILSGKLQKANVFLTKIAKLMRNILENSREEFILLEKEIETIKLYLDLQQLRFENEFEYHIIVDDLIDPENISIPPMLTQPCVENSVEHGLLPLKGKGNLKINYSLNNGLMKLEVVDNGIGREEAARRAVEKKSKRSVSTQVTKERLENFRKTMKQKNISFEISDLYDDDKAAGTRVIMMLPYKKTYG
jgi:tetratricopeptide (TPR) repeat protein